MNAASEWKRPGGSRGGRQAKQGRHSCCDYKTSLLPRDWRDHLPPPAVYFAQALPSLKAHGTGWSSARCLFHDDHTASLSVNLGHGGWRCHACGLAGDLIQFHMRRHDLAFNEALRDLLRWWA